MLALVGRKQSEERSAFPVSRSRFRRQSERRKTKAFYLPFQVAGVYVGGFSQVRSELAGLPFAFTDVSHTIDDFLPKYLDKP